jgi:hypothetical protein
MWVPAFINAHFGVVFVRILLALECFDMPILALAIGDNPNLTVLT